MKAVSLDPIKRLMFGILALMSFSIGIAGIVLPGLPLTELMVLTVWAADRSSPRFHTWLVNQPVIKTALAHFQQGLVSRKVKVISSISMGTSCIFVALKVQHLVSMLSILFIICVTCIWLWFRPEEFHK